MPKALVVVESPAKAKTINKYLGRDFKVVASMGHVRDLPKSKLGVNIEDGFQPEYVVLPDRAKVIKELKELTKTADEVFVATDPDREGEAIAWHVAETIKPKRGTTGVNALISRSRSTMSRSATVCTRPAESPFFTVFQSSGLAL